MVTVMDSRDLVFIILTLIGISGFLISAYVIGLHTSSSSIMGGMEEMMQRMMGTHSWGMHIPIYLWYLTILFIVLIIVGVIGFLFTSRTERDQAVPKKVYEHEVPADVAEKPGIEDILKVLKPDERRVVEVLIKNNGKMYQKDLRWETGYTRLKIHRIINRLVERKIVRKRSVGNTNEIVIEDWILERLRGRPYP
jgi:hypothetical protein